MLPFTKILWPTDFSEPSMEALKTANEIASRFSAELIIVHVITPIPVAASPPGPGGFDVGLYEQELEKSAQKSLEDIVKNKVAAGVEARYFIRTGNAADEIVRAAEEEKTDLIVIATHGETGWRHLIFGSVAEKVVRTSTCPVLSIRAPKKE